MNEVFDFYNEGYEFYESEYPQGEILNWCNPVFVKSNDEYDIPDYLLCEDKSDELIIDNNQQTIN
jgi:hypothetical protein